MSQTPAGGTAARINAARLDPEQPPLTYEDLVSPMNQIRKEAKRRGNIMEWTLPRSPLARARVLWHLLAHGGSVIVDYNHLRNGKPVQRCTCGRSISSTVRMAGE